MHNFQYSRKSLYADYLRACIGLFITLGLLIAATKITIFQYIFAGGAILFFGFLLRTLSRQLTSFTISEDVLTKAGLSRRTLPWSNLTSAALKYFSTRRDRNAGWYELTVKSNLVTVTVDSDLIGFEKIMENCVVSIERNKVNVSETTEENFLSSGFPLARTEDNSDAKTDTPTK